MTDLRKVKVKEWAGQVTLFKQPKFDGLFCRYQAGRFFSRQGNELLPECEDAADISLLPNDVYIDGELWVPDQPASYVKSAIKRGELCCFAAFATNRFPDDTSLFIVNSWLLEVGACAVDVYHFDDEVEFQDCEGVMYKNGNYKDWYRYKPVRTADLIVTAVRPGTGKYLGMAGALVVATAEGYEVANVSGMDDATRARISKRDVGRVVEVQYQYVGSGGRLRHPTFVRWRDDKLPDCCTADQLPGYTQNR